MKAFANTAFGHFVVQLLVYIVGAVLAYLAKDPNFSAVLLSIGVPASLVKLIIDLLRSNVPNV